MKKRPPAAAAKKLPAQQKTKSIPKARATLAPKRHPFHAPTSAKGEALLREASNLDANRFTVSAAFVLRSFVELATNDYMDANGMQKTETNKSGQTTEMSLTTKAQKVVEHITKTDPTKKTDFRGFQNNIITKTSPISIQSLNGFVHNKFQIPTADTLRSGWDCTVPLFIATYGSV